jgi:hypothetical protein
MSRQELPPSMITDAPGNSKAAPFRAGRTRTARQTSEPFRGPPCRGRGV